MKSKRKKVLVGASIVLASAALFVGLSATGAINVGNNLFGGGSNPAAADADKDVEKPIETDEENKLREQAFTYVPKNSMLVAQVHTSDMSDKDLDSWWEWYRQMSPHPQSLPATVSETEGLKSLILSYYPSDDEEFSELYMMDYTYVLAFDSVTNRDNAITPLFERMDKSEDLGTLGEAVIVPVEDDEDSLIVYAPVSALSEVEDLEEGKREKADLKQIPLEVADAPTLYLNANDFLAPYTAISDEEGGAAEAIGQIVKQSVFAVEESDDPDATDAWVGTSDNYGKTWVNTSATDEDPKTTYERFSSNVNAETIVEDSEEIFSEIMSEMLEGLEGEEGEDNPGYTIGAFDVAIGEGIADSFSIKSPGVKEVFGSIKDPYDITQDEKKEAEAKEGNEEDEFVMVFSPRRFHNWYTGSGLYTQIYSVTFRATSDQSSVEFVFDEAGLQ